MNATLKSLRGIRRSECNSLTMPAGQTATGSMLQRDNAPGSYGRGSYAGHSTQALDFSAQGSYGRGSYAGRSTYDMDFCSAGSYGRGSYAGRSTATCDFNTQGSFASGA
jgi:hypothetical protein